VSSALDLLTWLPNRPLFEARLGRALLAAQRSRTALALLHVDLDRFRDFNELFGAELGDRVLRQAAARMSRALGSGAALARLGGDDFAAVVRAETLAEAIQAAGELLRACAEPYVLEGVSVPVTVSVGIALFPAHADDAAGLLRCADRALYEAKLAGRNRIYPAMVAPERVRHVGEEKARLK
jgi:diguanylate cyclase (GGDEF)-like protein